MHPGRLFCFFGSDCGSWRVRLQAAIVGEPLPQSRCVELVPGIIGCAEAAWVLRGITSNERYVERVERNLLLARQEGLGRPAATRAALIPIRKNAGWWALPQDERRAIFERQSRHTATGLKFLPAVARRLHHCRDLSDQEPFDFLTWFEYAPRDEGAFDELLAELRASAEWHYVEREVEIRLERAEEADPR